MKGIDKKKKKWKTNSRKREWENAKKHTSLLKTNVLKIPIK